MPEASTTSTSTTTQPAAWFLHQQIQQILVLWVTLLVYDYKTNPTIHRDIHLLYTDDPSTLPVIIQYSSHRGWWCQNEDRGHFYLFYNDAQTPAGAGGVLLNRPQTKQRGFKSLVYGRTQGDNPDTQQDTQTIWIRNICKAGLCNGSLLFPKQEQRGTKSSEDWRRATASLCSVIQTHDRTAAWSHEDRGGSFSPQRAADSGAVAEIQNKPIIRPQLIWVTLW